MFDVSIKDSADLKRAFVDTRPEIVSHHAAQISIRNSMLDPTGDVELNIIGSLNVLQCAAEHDVESLKFASAIAVQSNPEQLPLKETHPKTPSPYAWSLSSAWKTSSGRTLISAASSSESSVTAMHSVPARISKERLAL